MAPPRLGVIGKIKDILTGKSPELYSPPGTLRDTQGNIVISPKEALPMGGISPYNIPLYLKPSGGGGNNPSQPIQSDNSEAIRIAELERLAEIERQRILQQQQQREAEQQKLNELAQQKRREEFIALGKGAQTEVLTDEFIGGKRVSELKYTIKQMPGETKEAFEFRAAQLGKAGTASLEAKRRLPNETTSQFEARTKPFTREIPTKEFLKHQEQIELNKNLDITQSDVNESLVEVNTRFGSGGSAFGKFLDIGSDIMDRGIEMIPNETRFKLNFPVFVGAGGSFKIDVPLKEALQKKFIPPSVANPLAQFGDISFKSILFGQYMKTGTASKQAAVVEEKQVSGLKVMKEYNKQFEKQDIGEAIITKLEKSFKTGGRAGVERDILKLGESVTTKEEAQSLASIFQEASRRGLVRGTPSGSPSVAVIKQAPTSISTQGELIINMQQFPSSLENIEGIVTISSLVKERQTQPNINAILQSNLPNQLQLLKPLSLTGTVSVQSILSKQEVNQIQQPKTEQKAKQDLKLNQLTLQSQLQFQKQKIRLDQRLITTFPTPRGKPRVLRTKPTGAFPILRLKGYPKQSFSKAVFIGSVRRRGKFKPVSRGSLNKVIIQTAGIGQRGLGQTIKIRKVNGGLTRNIRTPRGFAKVRDLFGVFRETAKNRINTGSEIRLLALAKAKKKRKSRPVYKRNYKGRYI